jgi:hypothetical protein
MHRASIRYTVAGDICCFTAVRGDQDVSEEVKRSRGRDKTTSVNKNRANDVKRRRRYNKYVYDSSPNGEREGFGVVLVGMATNPNRAPVPLLPKTSSHVHVQTEMEMMLHTGTCTAPDTPGSRKDWRPSASSGSTGEQLLYEGGAARVRDSPRNPRKSQEIGGCADLQDDEHYRAPTRTARARRDQNISICRRGDTGTFHYSGRLSCLQHTHVQSVRYVPCVRPGCGCTAFQLQRNSNRQLDTGLAAPPGLLITRLVHSRVEAHAPSASKWPIHDCRGGLLHS